MNTSILEQAIRLLASGYDVKAVCRHVHTDPATLEREIRKRREKAAAFSGKRAGKARHAEAVWKRDAEALRRVAATSAASEFEHTRMAGDGRLHRALLETSRPRVIVQHVRFLTPLDLQRNPHLKRLGR